jgi:hypothetical protein
MRENGQEEPKLSFDDKLELANDVMRYAKVLARRAYAGCSVTVVVHDTRLRPGGARPIAVSSMLPDGSTQRLLLLVALARTLPPRTP